MSDIKKQMRILRPKCDNCPNQAEYNFQEVFITYALENHESDHSDFEYVELDAVNSGDNLFYCRECAEEVGYL